MNTSPVPDVSKVKKTVGLYQRLFSLPSNQILSGLAIISIVLNIFELSWFYLINPLIAIPFMIVLWVSISIIPSYIIQSRVLSIRRSIGLGSIGLLIIGLFNIVFISLALLINQTLTITYYGMLLGLLFFYLNVILHAMCYNREIRIGGTFFLLFSILGAFTLLNPSALFSLPLLQNLAITPGLFYLGSFLFIWIINAPAKAVLGVGGFVLFQGFVDEWLEGDSVILDDIFTDIGIKTRLTIQSLEFRSKDTQCFLVAPEIHPGPFKSIGSSTLSFLLRQQFGNQVFITHSACTHDLNLVSKKETNRLVELLSHNLQSPSIHTSTSATKFITSTVNSMSITGQIFGNTGLFFASNVLNNSDDIDRSIAKLAKDHAKYLNLEHLLLVDAHHGVEDICDPLMPFSFESEDLLSAIKHGIKTGQQQNQSSFEFGAAHQYPTPHSVTEGFGPAGISCLVIKTEKETTCYLSIDANNMVVGLREKIVETLKRHNNFTHVEISTTDTHMVTGLDTRGMGFNPLGERIEHSEIVSICDNLAHEAVSKLNPGTMAYRELQVDDAKALGHENMDAFTTLISGSAKLAKSVGISLIGLLFSIGLLNLLTSII